MSFHQSLYETVRDTAQFVNEQSQWVVALYVFLGTIALLALKSWWDSRRVTKAGVQIFQVGEITLDELERYSGTDPFLPILMAVRGVIYDVTKGREFYGPGGGYSKFAGRETSRALATMSLSPDDFTANLDDLTEKQWEILRDWEAKFNTKYPVVGKVCLPLKLTLEELIKYDGNDPKLPMLLAIQGTIFDVSKGKQFYGPDGIYPFAGRECARAFGLLSTETSECTDNLDGLDKMELDNLRDWQAKFYSKYKLVGTVAKENDVGVVKGEKVEKLEARDGETAGLQVSN